jgi:uncharacterized protein YjbJ (UPF0337 family)
MKGDPIMRSSRQDRAAGKADTLAGKLLEFVGRITGDRTTSAKGKAARGRGAGRTAKGRVKGAR